MKERIRAVMEYARQSQQDFALRLGISPASLSSIYTGRTNPTNNHVMAVHRAFPEININWLMFGEGQMILENVIVDCNNSLGEKDKLNESDLNGLTGSDGMSSILDSNELSCKEANHVSSAASLGGVASTHRSSNADYASAHASYRDYRINAINIDKTQRKIKEIRVFFDDGTYESFVPSSK